MAEKNGYGVLASDTSKHEAMVSFARDIESRLCVPHPKGDGSVLTLVTRLGEDGRYEFLVEDHARQAHIKCLGNIYDDTGAPRPSEERNESER